MECIVIMKSNLLSQTDKKMGKRSRSSADSRYRKKEKFDSRSSSTSRDKRKSSGSCSDGTCSLYLYNAKDFFWMFHYHHTLRRFKR
jgi:hypothetical protein